VYRLLVVDDEPRQLKGLANIISQLRPEYILSTASDGQEAFEIIQNNPTDILITDIRMPVMDGLELIQKLRETGKNLKIIIISGYGEFEYAQKAVRFGVKDYLVKPISKSDLEKLLDSVEKSLKEEEYQKKLQESLKEKLDYSLPVYIERQMNKWIVGKLNEDELNEILSIFPHNKYGAVLIISFGKYTNHRNTDISAEITQYIKHGIKEALKDICHTFSFPLDGYNNVIVTVSGSDRPFDAQSTDVIKRINEFISSARREFGAVLSAGISSSTDNIFKNITKHFEQALSAWESKFCLGLGQAIPYTPYKQQSDIFVNSFEEELSCNFNNGDKASMMKTTEKAFQNMNQCFLQPEKIKDEWIHLIINIIKTIRPFLTENEYDDHIARFKKEILKTEDYKELWHCVNNILCSASDLLQLKGKEKNNIIIEMCRKHINERYMEQISMESVAQKYFFNPSYFSSLFKNHTGIGFSEYLLQVRIKHAKEMLKNTKNSISSIAEQVGFKDPAYFNRAFKRITGLTPLKYRQIN